MRKSIFGRAVAASLLGVACLALAACGGGGGGGSSATSVSSTSSTPAASSPTVSVQPSQLANQVPVTIEQNPAETGFVTANTPYVTVSVCDAVGNCVNVDHVLVDTMSSGLRIFGSALGSLNLPTPTGASATAQTECSYFGSGYTWGSVRLATVKMAGETASSIPVQVVADPSLSSVADPCAGSGSYDYNSAQVLGSNGILGVATFLFDGQAYYDCSSGTCTSITVTHEVGNPVAQFASDNNGVVLSLPAQTVQASTATGTLTFGIDTQSDNSQAGYTVVPTSADGQLTAQFNGGSYPQSIVDSGSNMDYLYMPGEPTQNLGGVTWISPVQTTAFPLTLSGPGAGVYASSITLTPATNYARAPQPVSPYMAQSSSAASMQDFGLPFFYGRPIAVTFSGKVTYEGTGPMIGFGS